MKLHRTVHKKKARKVQAGRRALRMGGGRGDMVDIQFLRVGNHEMNCLRQDGPEMSDFF